MIAENLAEVEKKIEAACQRAGRKRDTVTLIAVSKTKPLPLLEEAYAYGCRDFGENRVQELIWKYEAMPKDIRWHMIGHLQRNKVKYVVGKAFLIHSVDSLSLAQEISRQSVKRQLTTNILIEVNVAGEASKFGLHESGEVIGLVSEAAKLPGISIKGLMTVAPPVKDPEENREYFRALRQLSVDIMQKNIDNVSMAVLSMGMTGDYETAVTEGAAYVRVGTGIFGEREGKRSESEQ